MTRVFHSFSALENVKHLVWLYTKNQSFFKRWILNLVKKGILMQSSNGAMILSIALPIALQLAIADSSLLWHGSALDLN
jgi:hypothetical protein